MWRSWSVLAITSVVVTAISEVRAADNSNNSAETEAVTVTGEATGSLTSVSPEESAKQKTEVPGPFTVKTADEMNLGRASNSAIREGLLQTSRTSLRNCFPRVSAVIPCRLLLR